MQRNNYNGSKTTMRKPRQKSTKQLILGGIAAIATIQTLLDLDMNIMRRLMTRKELHASDGHMTISRKYNLLYVHVPKTGGTSMETSALFADAREHHELGGHHPIAEMLANSHERELNSVVKAAHIRHPCDRFVSAFNYLKESGNKGDKRVSEKYGISSQSIDEFASNFNKKGWHPYEIRHFVPQVEYVFYTHDGINEKSDNARDRPDGTFGLDMLMCTENWSEGFERLEGMLGRSIPSSVKEAHTNSLSHMTCEDLNPDTRAIIERVYAMDYCVFDYPSLPSERGTEDSCVGEYTTPEMFTAKYKECLAKHRPEEAEKKKPEAVWPEAYLEKLKTLSRGEDDDAY